MKNYTMHIGVGKNRKGEFINTSLVDNFVDIIMTDCSRAFGGCTVTHAIGAWMDNSMPRRLVKEPCIRVDVGVPDTGAARLLLDKQVQYAGRLLDQDTVMLTLPWGEIEFHTIKYGEDVK